MIKKNYKLILAIALLAVFVVIPVTGFAVGLSDQIKTKAQGLFGASGYVTDTAGGAPLALRIGVILNSALLLVGILFLAFVVYSGIQWMMAGGNEENVEKARSRIINAAVGLAIVLGAWAITSFILNAAFSNYVTPPPEQGVMQIGTF